MLRAASTFRRRATRTSSSTSSGAASAPAPSACCGPVACRSFPAWAIRWCRVTNRSAGSARPGRAPAARVGERVFVPGARCFGEVRGLFGGAARGSSCRAHVVPVDELRRAGGAAGAGRHRLPRLRRTGAGPDLIVGHGVLGRLLARLAVVAGAAAAHGLGAQPERAAAPRAIGDRSRRRPAPRLPTPSTTSAATRRCSTR